MSTAESFRLAVIVLNYRTPELVLDCLRSLDGQLAAADERALVVDNGSGDGSADMIRAAIRDSGWGSWASLVEAGGNHGFSAGNNVGIRSIRAEAYLLLNSDTLLRPSAIAELRQALRANPEVDLFSPRLEWPDGVAQQSVFRMPTPWSELDRSAGSGPVTRLLGRHGIAPPVVDHPIPFAWASFAAILIRRRAFETIGLLDEGYFLYFEDVDFCHRARKAGLRSLHWPAAHVVHLRGGSGPVKQSIAQLERPPLYYYASRNRYFGKFHGRIGLFAANALWWLGRCVSWPREILRNKARHLCAREGRDIWYRFARPVDPPEWWRGELD